ncbi:MAG: hypothetical protein ACWGNK_06055 [Desulfobacterales bacterium]
MNGGFLHEKGFSRSAISAGEEGAERHLCVDDYRDPLRQWEDKWY